MSATVDVRARRARFRRALQSWAQSSLREMPWRKRGRTGYEVMIAELLLKRTTAAAAARSYPGFLRRYPSIRELALASESDLVESFAPIGLQHQRARSVRALAAHLIENEDGEIPSDLGRLLAVPGIGVYSARAVLSFAHDQPFAVVDSNVRRVLTRVFEGTLSPRATEPALQEVADVLLPREGHALHNFALLDLSAAVCRYQRPRCNVCPLARICDARSRFLDSRIAPRVPTELQRLRIQMGLTLVELAANTGLSKATIVSAEAGRTRPSAHTLRKLGEVLGSSRGRLQK